MFEAVLRPRLIFVEPAARHISVLVQPAQSRECWLEERPHEIWVARPVPQRRDHHGIKGRGRYREVVQRIGIEVQRRERTLCRLMQHAPWLFIAPVVALRPLQPGQLWKSTKEKILGRQRCLPRRRQRVAPGFASRTACLVLREGESETSYSWQTNSSSVAFSDPGRNPSATALVLLEILILCGSVHRRRDGSQARRKSCSQTYRCPTEDHEAHREIRDFLTARSYMTHGCLLLGVVALVPEYTEESEG